ncbi:MAG: hypothetical protein II684_08405, partial [Treponema sp.]|nr:hypothetical protein [Treponema sp.]
VSERSSTETFVSVTLFSRRPGGLNFLKTFVSERSSTETSFLSRFSAAVHGGLIFFKGFFLADFG